MGLIIQNNGKNDATIELKTKKALVITNIVQSKISFMKSGKYLMQTVAILRDSVLLGSLLYGTEVLYNLSNEDLKKLAKADAMFLKSVLDLNPNIPDCLVLLEFGLEPIEIKIRKRRALYLKYILDHEEGICFQILKEQMKKTLKSDWWADVLKDFKLSLSMTLKKSSL